MAEFNLASAFAGHLNIEADQANLIVLRHWLRALGHEVRLHAVYRDEQLANLESFDFVLVGHGVDSAWHQIDNLQPQFQQHISHAISTGTSGLLVASAWDRYVKSISRPFAQGERKSLFASGSIEPDSTEQVFGYVNTATISPVISVEGDFLLTQLHGPIFAKNSWLTMAVINRMLTKRALQPIRSISDHESLVKIAELEAKAIAANEYANEPLL